VEIIRQVTEIMGKQELILDFACRTGRNAEESGKFSLPLAPAAFSDVGGDRDGSPPQLDHQSETFLNREALSVSINLQRTAMRLMPDFEFFEVSHGLLYVGFPEDNYWSIILPGNRFEKRRLQMQTLVAGQDEHLDGVLSCFDRVVIIGSLPDICYSEGLAAHLSAHHIRLFDFTQWAEPLRNELRENAETLAAKEGIEIEFIRRNNFRKDKRIKEITAQRGDHPGLVHIYSAMEPCMSFRAWHDKQTHRTFLKTRQAQCLHYYFYFIDQDLGLCYLRVPTWAPFRLQFYFNGHNWLANRLEKRGIDFTLLDNAFIEVSDYDEAQRISDRFDIRRLHRKLDTYSRQLCPVVKRFRSGLHWSIMQVEYATDLVFKNREALSAIYEPLVRTAVHAVKAENVATFLGRKLHGQRCEFF
jgi:hypothetical protein